MEKYHIVIEGLPQGPFTLDELEVKEITANTLVWTEKMENWTEAKNVEQLKNVIKKVPPQIPLPSEKPLKVESEISKKKEKLITPETEVLVAKETKVNFKLIFFALLIGLISYPIVFSIKDGFANLNMADKLQRHLDNYGLFFNLSEERKQQLYEEGKNFESESKRLGYRSYNSYYSSWDAITYHKWRIKDAAKNSVVISLITALVSALILILGRYITKGAKWVEETSKKEV